MNKEFPMSKGTLAEGETSLATGEQSVTRGNNEQKRKSPPQGGDTKKLNIQ